MKMILDIPDAAVLASASLDEAVETYCSRLKVKKPDAICLPLVDYGGANYDSDYIDENTGHWALSDFAEIARRVKEHFDSELYLSINAGLPFIEAKPFVLRDQYNDDKVGVCIVNPGIQTLHQRLLAEAIEVFRPTGILLDLSDINGMGATEGRLFTTCFCQHCVAEMKRLGNLDPGVFSTHPNPLNLVLRDSGTGIRSFDIDTRIRDIRQFVELAKSNRTYDEELCGSNAEGWARTIIDYVDTRCRITARALDKIGKEAREQGVRIAVTICAPRFDWTSGIDLAHLGGVAEEVWLETNDVTPEEITQLGLEVHHLLFSKGRYTVDALFEIISSRDRMSAIARGLTSASQPVEAIIENRIAKVVGASQFLLSNKTAIELQGVSQGVVGIPLTEDFIRRMVNRAHRVIKEARKTPLIPTEKEAGEEEKRELAQAVLASLARWLQTGQPITTEVLNAVAQQLTE